MVTDITTDGNFSKQTEKRDMRDMEKFEANPFLADVHLKMGKKRISVARGSRLVDKEGEVAFTEICQIREVDKEEFVKLYTANLKVFFDLSPAGQKVLRYVLAVVQDLPNQDKIFCHHADCEERFPGEISRATYFRGVGEMLAKAFLAQSKMPNHFYINPSLFWNGDRARFVMEYRRARTA